METSEEDSFCIRRLIDHQLLHIFRMKHFLQVSYIYGNKRYGGEHIN